MTGQELEARLRHEIPLSAAMNVRVVEISPSRATLSAPLQPNINHKSTAFGGSVHSLAVLSCWALVTSHLSEQDVSYVVIQDSQIQYLKPVTSDFSARAAWESAEALEKFVMTLKRKKLARIQLTSEVLCDGVVCAKLTGTFVAQVGS